MIEVTYYRKYHRVTVTGHAKSAPMGQDLVCAAASALAFTLSENCKALEKGGQARSFKADLTPGKAVVECVPISRFQSVVTVIFDAVCLGFDKLGKVFPDHIKYEIR